MREISKVLFTLLLILSAGLATVMAQDIHYSQMYSTPLYVNPALTGNHECDVRVGLNYRQQAASFTTPFTTYTAWADAKLTPNFLGKRSWLGIGGHMYYDNAGEGSLTKVTGTFLASFNQGFNSDNSFYGSLGVGIGYTNRSVDQTKLIFGDQWDPINLRFDPDNIATQEALASNSIFYPDFSLGLAVHQVEVGEWGWEAGFSLSHINEPDESFFGEANRLGMKYIVHGAFHYIISDMLMIKPEAYYVAHEGTNEIIFGGNLVADLMTVRMHGGLWYRVGRDIVPVLGMEYNKFTFLFSYDVNVSQQRLASDYQGGFEFSLVKKICIPESTKRKPCKYLEF